MCIIVYFSSVNCFRIATEVKYDMLPVCNATKFMKVDFMKVDRLVTCNACNVLVPRKHSYSSPLDPNSLDKMSKKTFAAYTMKKVIWLSTCSVSGGDIVMHWAPWSSLNVI